MGKQFNMTPASPDFTRLDTYDYALPQELIAQTPLRRRDGSRLLCLDCATGAVGHRHFYDIAQLLNPGDTLVINDSRVIPARLLGVKLGTGVAVEFVLLRQLSSGENCEWEIMCRPGRRLHVGDRVEFGGGVLRAEIMQTLDGGNRRVRFEFEGIFMEALERVGKVPLPPYITEPLEDDSRYQTVYAKHDGSAAAPTAGLHFTQELLDEVQARGINVARVLLHVGLGTFRPVKTDNVLEHHMHSEFFRIDGETCELLNRTRRNGGRIVAVGTTCVRVLETVATEDGTFAPTEGDTSIFIYPPYRFKAIDALITNFHLPKSTLLMLVCAFGGYEHVMEAYRVAVEERYRFFSFGDAMMLYNGKCKIEN